MRKLQKSEYEQQNVQNNEVKSEQDDHTVHADSSDEARQSDDVQKATNDGSDTKDAIQIKVDKIMKKIAKALGISTQELSAVMTALNLNVADLMTQEGLQTFLEDNLGITDGTQLLVDSNTFAQYKELKQAITQILDESGMDLETLKQFVEEQAAVPQTENETTTEPVDHQEEATDTEQAQTAIATQTQSVQTRQAAVASASTPEKTTEDATAVDTVEVSVTDLRTDKEVTTTAKTSENASDGKEEDAKNSFQNLFTNSVSQKSTVQQAMPLKEVFTQMNTAQTVMDQIVTNAKVVLTDDAQSMTIQLQPENLGKIALSITTEKGTMTGKFVAENLVVKEAIEVNLINLKNSLNEQGIKVDNLEVVVGNTSQFYEKNNQEQSMNQFARNRRKKLVNMDVVEGIEQKIEDLRSAVNMAGIEGQEYSVNYTA